MNTVRLFAKVLAKSKEFNVIERHEHTDANRIGGLMQNTTCWQEAR